MDREIILPRWPAYVHIWGPSPPTEDTASGSIGGVALTLQMHAFNTSMSAFRIVVEWLFREIINYFKFVDFKKNLKSGLSRVGKLI